MECILLVLLLIRYNELGLKSPRVRGRFQNQLIKNIESKFLNAGQDCFIDSDWGRIYVHTDDAALGIRLLVTVFGVFSVSPVIAQSANLEEISEAAVDYAKSLLKHGQSFALRTRRIGTHEFTSQDVAVRVGEAIRTRLKELELSVDLTSPDVEIFIEVRRNSSYIFSESYQGPGGLPLGTQGKVLSIFSDRQSFIAAWLMMKRGCRIYPVYLRPTDDDIETEAQTEVQAQARKQEQEQLEIQAQEERLRAQLDILKIWAPNLDLEVIDTKASVADKNYDHLSNKELINFARRTHVKAICVSWDFERFLKHGSGNGSGLPVFYPLIGLDKGQLTELATKIKEVTTISK